MNHSSEERAIALAGIYQACTLVDQISNHGMADSAPLEASIGSLFEFDAADTPAVFGGIGGVITGLRSMRDFLLGNQERNIQVSRYVITLLHLERKLSRKPDVLNEIAQRLQRSTDQVTLSSLLNSSVIASLADTYSNTVSNLSPKVMVNGEPTYLQNPDNVNRIRALLLAGVRSAILWRQCGGSRWQIFFQRGRYIDDAEALMKRSMH